MSSKPAALIVRTARPDELNACISIWEQACEARDGRRVKGIADDARTRFAHCESWLIAESPSGIAGFVLCTKPGADLPTDPPDAPVVSMLAVAPDHQGLGAAKGLLQQALTDLAQQGHSRAVLHVFADNAGAVRLYESTGWQRIGGEIMIDPAGRRPSWTYSHVLIAQAG
jgi:ribosomal protein S18 acetylase RimI-like enzyme